MTAPGTPTSVVALSPEWFELRRRHITATDWPKLLLRPEQWSRREPFGSPLSVWEKLSGRRLASEDEAAHLAWGRWLEGSHAAWLQDILRATDPTATIERCSVAWMRGQYECSPDGFVADRGGRALLELKAPTPFSAEWTDAVPLEYAVAAQAGMWVTGTPRAYVSSLRFPGPPRWAVIDYDAVAVERWLRALEAFWERHVARDEAPAPTGSERDREILQALRAEQDGGKTVAMPADIVDLCCQIDEATSRREAYAAKDAELRNQLRAWLIKEGASRAVDPAGGFSWTFGKTGLRRARR